MSVRTHACSPKQDSFLFLSFFFDCEKQNEDGKMEWSNCLKIVSLCVQYFELVLFFSRYDLILTSETIYNVKSYPKLLRVFSLLLEETGVVYP